MGVKNGVPRVIYTTLQNYKNLYNILIVHCYVRVSAWQKVK